MIKNFTPPVLHTFSILKKKKCKIKSKGRLIQNPNYDIPSLPLHTSERAVLIEIKAL